MPDEQLAAAPAPVAPVVSASRRLLPFNRTLPVTEKYTFVADTPDAPDYWLVWVDPTPASLVYVYLTGSGEAEGPFVELANGGAARLPTRNRSLTVYSALGTATVRAFAVNGMEVWVNPQTGATVVSGAVTVNGAAADGAAIAGAGNPVYMAGQDGSLIQAILTDSGGRQIVVGAAGSGQVTVGNPVLVGGQDGTNARTLLTDTGGRAVVLATAQLDSSNMRDGAGVALTPKYAFIEAATNGDNTLVALVSGKKIRVLALMLIAAGTVTARLQSGAAGAYLTGSEPLTAGAGWVMPFSPVGWCETASGALLNLELNAAVNCGGCLVYVEV